jgi:hypothetical protein
MHPEDKKRKRNILRKSLKIIDNMITEIDAELYGEGNEDE